MMRKKAVLFDLDGTLLDTTEYIYQAYEHALTSHGFTFPGRKILAPLIGKSLQAIYGEIAPGGNLEILCETHLSFQNKNSHLIKSFPNISKVLTKLKKSGIKLGVVTSRYKNALETLKVGGLEGLFDVVVTANDVTNQKPHPEGILLAMDKLKTKLDSTLMVGDAESDILAGRNAGVKTVAVTYGFAGKDILKHNPDFVIDDLEDLIKIIQNPSSFPKNMGQKSSLK